MPFYPGVTRLEGEESFYQWHRSIKLYARQVGCHRTLEGYLTEPARRSPPAGSVPGQARYDRIRPPNQHAGDCPPTEGQCDYVGGALLIEDTAMEFDDTLSIANHDLGEWKYWSTMEAKSQALILGTVSPSIEAYVADQWCAHDMFRSIVARFGTRPSFDNLRLSSTQTTADQLLSHLAEYQNRIKLAKSINKEYKPDMDTVDHFKRSLNTSIKHTFWGEWLKVPFSQRTWDHMVFTFQQVVEDTRQLKSNSDARVTALPPTPVSPLPTP